jgi:F-type H+-transporting ATPase subunit a
LCAPIQEIALLHHALTLIPSLVTADPEPFVGPSVEEFFPEPILFIGTPFEMNRIMIIRVVVALIVMLVFWLGTRRMKIVPTRFQGAVEYLLAVPRNISTDLLGEKDGPRFLPLLTTIFFVVISANFTGIIPPANIASTSLIGLPIVLAVVSYVTFIYAGIKKHPGAFFKNSLFPPGVPWPLYLIVTPIEFVSTFVLRPITLTLRLLMNMLVGHLLLVLFFLATNYFIVTLGGGWSALGVGILGFAFAWTGFEILVAVLQAYVFTLLTAVYLQLALADEH